MTRARARAVLLVLVLIVADSLSAGISAARPWAAASSSATPGTCVRTAAHPGWSVARRWDEAALDAIRRAIPAPTQHARNLFHLSVAMWDAWAAYDPTASGYVTRDKASATDVAAARNEAISYAAFRVLTERYVKAVGADVSLSEFADVMDSLCYPVTDTATTGNSPAAVGNRIGAAVIAYGKTDGSNEAGDYGDPSYKPVNPPLVVANSGTTMLDPNRWQPLLLKQSISQNGILVSNKVQTFIGSQWGHVKGFGLPDGGSKGVPMDPGAPPRLGAGSPTDQDFKQNAIAVIRASSTLDPAQDVMMDIAPDALGNNTLGTNDGHGRTVDPATNKPYAPEVVNQADFYRSLAEFWADGPKSETPPGHWNVIANTVSDQLPAQQLRIGGTGSPVSRLEWDVKLYLALNGAVHDAAIAAWGLKGYYDSTRPISMIRYMGGLGQSSDPKLPSYNPEGLPLVPGLVELITKETTAPGQRHEALAGHEGEIAIKAWGGNPKNPKTQTGGVKWILAIDWVPYQLDTFVTPAFAAYASGHSSFSRAAAEVMTGFTASPYFPGGIGSWTFKANSLKFEAGPSTDIVLEWATYYDAADQAGLSRIYGGIHIPFDDFSGRKIGSECGTMAWQLAQLYYQGKAPK